MSKLPLTATIFLPSPRQRAASLAAASRERIGAVTINLSPSALCQAADIVGRKLARGGEPPAPRTLLGKPLADHELDGAFADRRQGLVQRRQGKAIGRVQQFG